MIRYKTGDIFKEDVEAIVNTVNCVGVMGRGIALQFKKVFPENFKAYAAACKRKEVQPGKMFVYETGQLTNPRFIINFPTKLHWRQKSNIEDIELGLVALVDEVRSRDIKSIAIPPLGSGLGGLNWGDVRSRIDHALKGIENIDVIIFEPKTETIISPKSAIVPAMTAGRAALVNLVDRYLGGLMDPCVTLLELHKLMYFLQEAGEPLRLQYKKALYGPYAENLRHVLSAIEGYLILGYSDGGDKPDKKIELMPGALQSSMSFLQAKAASNTQKNLEKVAELVEGFETPFGLELLSTVYWIVKEENGKSINEIIEKIYAWNDRKKQFTARQIEVAYEVLKYKGWLVNRAQSSVKYFN